MSAWGSRQATVRRPVLAVAEPLTQPLASTRQAGPAGAPADVGDGGDLLVRQALQFSEDDDLAEVRGQVFHRPADQPHLILALQLLLGVVGVGSNAVAFLVEGRRAA